VYIGASKSPKESLNRAEELAKKALSLDDTLYYAHGQLALAYLFKRQFDKALLMAEKAVAFCPNSDFAHVMLGSALMHLERFEEAIPYFKKALRLRPHPFCQALNNLANTYRFLGRYDEAIATYKKMLQHYPDHLNGHLNLTATYALAGRQKEAEVEAAEVMRIDPKFFLKRYAKMMPYRKALVDELVQAWKKAGLPETPPLPLPDKPSIAVLPFVNMSGDPEQGYFSDGITEEIITALSKTPKLFVIARNSTFTYKNKPTKVQQVGRELGVKYVLEGSVRKAGDKVRVTAQLVDAQSGNHVWAERYDRELKDIFALQDEITKEIITALQVKLTEGEQARVYAKGTENLNAYVKVMEANWLFSQGTKDGVLKARQLAEEAIALDPNYAFAYKVLGSSHGMAMQLGLSKNPRESLKRAIELFRKAIELDDSLAMAHMSLGFWSLYTRQYDLALVEGRRAFELEPNSADVIMGYATILSMLGKPEEAIPLYKEALRLNPKPPNTYMRFLGIAFRDSGQYEDAIAQAKKAVEQEPNDLVSLLVLASSYSLAGRDEEARAAAKEILRLNPKFSVARYQRVSPHKDRAVAKRYCDALRKAGLPE
jgi:TolB-like protein/Tfp pilus assembly protein PilF